MSATITVTEATFEAEVLQSDIPVVVDDDAAYAANHRRSVSGRRTWRPTSGRSRSITRAR